VIWLCAAAAFVGFAGIVATERFWGLLSVPMAGDGGAATPSSMPATLTSMSVQEASDAGFVWENDGDGIRITGYNGSGGDVVIPYEIGGNSVTGIESGGSSYFSILTSVVIPDSVIAIDLFVFRDGGGLKEIAVHPRNDTYVSVDGILFTKDMDTLVMYPDGKTDSVYTIPDGVASIGKYAFSWCSSLTSVVIPNSVTSIGRSAFSGCSSLTSVVIPDSVTSIAAECVFQL
jgi:hypothetical protein